MKYSGLWFSLVAIATVKVVAQTGIPTPVVPIQLEPGKTIRRQLAGGQWHEFRFGLRAGQYARLIDEQQSVNLAVTVFRSDTKEILSADAYPIGDSEDVELIAESSGTYRMRVNASDPGAPIGDYTITLVEIADSTERHRQRVAAASAFARATRSYKMGTHEALLHAVSDLSSALTHWRAAGDAGEVAKTLYTLSAAYVELGDQQKALETATQSLASARQSGDPKCEGRALNSIGEVHNYFGDRRKAVDFYEQALPFMRSAGDTAGEGNALNNLAVAYAHSGEKNKALGLFAQAEGIFRELHDRQMAAEVAGNLGVTYDNLGEYQKALASHENALALQRELGERASQAICLNNIATAYSGLGEYQKSLDAYMAALEINRALDNRRSIAINLNNIAWIYDTLAERRRALNFYQESLEIVRRLNDRQTTAVTLNNIAEVYANLRDYRKALEIHTEALQLRRAVGDTDGEANTLHHLGTAYANLGEPGKAREHFERALAINRKSANPYMLARTLTSLGALDRETGNYSDSLARLDEALEVSRSIRDRMGEVAALQELARVERARGNFAAAHERAQAALTALESQRLAVISPALRASFFSLAREVQELDIFVLMRLHAQFPQEGFAAAGLVVAERGRARSLLEMLGEAPAQIRRGVDATLLEREQQLMRRVSAKAEQQVRVLSHKHTEAEANAAETEVDSLTADLDQVQSKIRATSPQYAALTQPIPLSLREIQTKVLDEGTLLLEYTLGSEKSFAWAVTPSSLDIFELPPRSEIETAVKRLYELTTARNRKTTKETLESRTGRIHQADEEEISAAIKTSNMLLAPLAAKLENKRLLIIGEGVLQYLPFAALPEPGNSGHGSALIANHEIVTAPSASVMAVLREETTNRKPAGKTIAIVADPVFSADDPRIEQRTANTAGNILRLNDVSGEAPRRQGNAVAEEFVRLRFSRNEAEEIARLTPPGSALKALDFDASRDTVTKPEFGRYRIAHFATHSLLDNEHPELSGIVLSLFDRAGHPQNGFLRLYDIYNLRLDSDLVVLSACETALGGEMTGEGLMGLTRGFLYAGAPRIVASLWPVDDRTTAEFMKRFYEGLLTRGETAAAALRRAQVAFWKTKGLEMPYYWAAFTLEGEWR